MRTSICIFVAAAMLAWTKPLAAQVRFDNRFDNRVNAAGQSEPPSESSREYYGTTPPNYNPFQFNWHSGKWEYVPIPYEPEPAGPNYNPFRFNWSSGKWDYVPIPESQGQPQKR